MLLSTSTPPGALLRASFCTDRALEIPTTEVGKKAVQACLSAFLLLLMSRPGAPELRFWQRFWGGPGLLMAWFWRSHLVG